MADRKETIPTVSKNHIQPGIPQRSHRRTTIATPKNPNRDGCPFQKATPKPTRSTNRMSQSRSQ